MKSVSQIAKHISSLCSGQWDKRYTRSKLSTDPLYEGVFKELEHRDNPLLDIGCGIGLLGLYLRERGWRSPITGFDYDCRKIESGLKLLEHGGYEGIKLSQGDARVNLPTHHGDVTILDILQFFEPEQQQLLLAVAATKVSADGKLIIRSGLKESNLRFFITWLGDMVAKCTFWMKAAPKHYPSAEFFQQALEELGFSVEVRPFWGNTPFNNYLIVAQRQE